MQENRQIINQYFKFLKDSGFRYWKDKLGFYLERNLQRFSIIQIGPYYDVYYNKKENNTFILKDKLTGQISLIKVLQWIFQLSKIK